MKIEVPTRAHIESVALRMRDEDVREFMALSHAATSAGMAGTVVDRFDGHPGLIGAYIGDKAVAIGAMVEARPNVVTLMFFATDDFASIVWPLTKFIRQRLFKHYRERGVHRIECVSIEGYDRAHRWIETLGLSHEADMPGFGRGGETFKQFAWVRDDFR